MFRRPKKLLLARQHGSDITFEPELRSATTDTHIRGAAITNKSAWAHIRVLALATLIATP